MWCGSPNSVSNSRRKCKSVVVRVVIKIGSSSLTDKKGRINADMIRSAADQIAEARQLGHEVVLVTSGSIAAGVAGLSLEERPSDILTLQALSAVGQPLLMDAYRKEFARHSIHVAQVLISPSDFVDRQQYLHARSTLERLLELNCVPIVNENDTLANDEIRYGDNDHLSALISHLLSADMLVLLTDTEGLYTADPRRDPTATIVSVVAADDPLLSVTTTGAGTERGSGGMASKLAAARIASWSGVTAVIASARHTDAVLAALREEAIGTRFLPHDRHLSSRKLWIAFAAETHGAVVVDDGAREALLTRGTSLLPAGVVTVRGTFDVGEVIDVVDSADTVIARGMSAVSSGVAAQSVGKRTNDLTALGVTEIVHRDDLVMFPQS
ncbi:MAG: glutamate 5-kinase [Actinomycetota bacterium]